MLLAGNDMTTCLSCVLMVVPLHIFAWKMGCCLACGEVRLFATKTLIFGTYPMYFDDFPIQIPPVFADFRVFEAIMKRVSSCPKKKKHCQPSPQLTQTLQIHIKYGTVNSLRKKKQLELKPPLLVTLWWITSKFTLIGI